MSIEKARNHLRKYGLEDRILEFSVSSATVALAAEAVGCTPEHIIKTLSFEKGDSAMLILACGTARIDNTKFKQQFGMKARMLPFEKVESLIGHGVGGVCPFGIEEGIDVWLDESLRNLDPVYPAAGTPASAVRLSVPELEACSEARGWVNVCKEGGA
ncbi:MAG: YbaK/EbsC family protein [Clostridia bacterium]|nr:YbaK/EbsC family protein [Clostridia bacterium]